MIDPELIDGTFVVNQHAAVASVELDGEAVLYHGDANTVHVLNETATLVWSCLDAVADLDLISADLAEAFSLPVETIRSDVVATVQEFGRQGLLEGVRPDPVAVTARLVPVAGEGGHADD